MVERPLVTLTGVSKTFYSSRGPNSVLCDVDLTIYPGEKVSISGISGSGKSTLLSLIMGLLQPDSGTVLFDGKQLNILNNTDISELRADSIGVALQSENLIPFLTALENVELTGSFGGKDVSRNVALSLLERMQVAHLAHYYPRQISGGETQRVALAVALANQPKLLIADEMTAQLDSETAQAVMKNIFTSDITVIFVTHSVGIAAKADRQYLVQDKKLVKI